MRALFVELLGGVMTLTIEVELEACEPGDLFNAKWPDGLWLRRVPARSMCHGVSIKGPAVAVLQFVSDHWGEDTLSDLADALGDEIADLSTVTEPVDPQLLEDLRRCVCPPWSRRLARCPVHGGAVRAPGFVAIASLIGINCAKLVPVEIVGWAAGVLVRQPNQARAYAEILRVVRPWILPPCCADPGDCNEASC